MGRLLSLENFQIDTESWSLWNLFQTLRVKFKSLQSRHIAWSGQRDPSTGPIPRWICAAEGRQLVQWEPKWIHQPGLAPKTNLHKALVLFNQMFLSHSQIWTISPGKLISIKRDKKIKKYFGRPITKMWQPGAWEDDSQGWSLCLCMRDPPFAF